MSTHASTFGRWMRDQRKLQRLTATECAERAGMKLPVWSNLENERSYNRSGVPARPSEKTVAAVAHGLNVSEDEARLAAGYAPNGYLQEMGDHVFLKDLSDLIDTVHPDKKPQIREAVKQLVRLAT